MRKLVLLFLGCFIAFYVAAQNVRLTGSIKGLTSGCLTLIQYAGEDLHYDTLKVASDGSFNASIHVLTPSTAYLQAEEMRAVTSLFVEPGMKADLQIQIVKQREDGQLVNKMLVGYSGDNRDCFDFLHAEGEDLFDRWPFERIDTLTFARYRELFLQDMDREKARVMGIKSLNFRRQKLSELAESECASLCRYAWSKADKNDPQFVAWIESFDRNDPQQLDMAARYQRWYASTHPREAGSNAYEGYFSQLRKIFTNQEVINIFADSYIQSVLKDAPEDMEQAYQAYCKTSTNEEGLAEAARLYAQYSKLKKGAQASDFEMYDKAGKKYTLKDFQGKALYIDCWATWCGPCCAEIPHMEKLYAHFKDNPKVEIISVSLDKNRRLWEQKVAADKPQWKQFICPDNFDSKLCKNYDIDAIPRFLMFDKQGRVVSLDAPRPSLSNIIEWINQNIE